MTALAALSAVADAGATSVGEDNWQSEHNYGYGRVATAIDLGLSVMWADHNVGADYPTQIGRYFGYGDVDGNETSNDPAKYAKGDVAGTDGDPAYVYWGGGWRMPTHDELQELCDRCRWTWVKNNGVEGFRVTGPNGNSIFLPVTGMKSNGELKFDDARGYYWGGEAIPGMKGYVPTLFFYKGGKLVKNYKTFYGFAIRPVKEDY